MLGDYGDRVVGIDAHERHRKRVRGRLRQSVRRFARLDQRDTESQSGSRERRQACQQELQSGQRSGDICQGAVGRGALGQMIAQDGNMGLEHGQWRAHLV